ncbi:MAG TPA: bifunctional glycosyltransferase/class I SAM-dependent methyltransferase, partial [Blastocatellia bacterium]|nr:bifunctional glycosyltransferase/class I SAM-dependent methyltransferase [Blastocatellia bacterium]
RVLALNHEMIGGLEVIVVDDRSTDGTWERLERIAAEDDRIILLRHERNMGKGAAIRTAISHATGDITIIHDGDLEYNPADIPSLLVPFAKEGADAVFGSRYLSAQYRRALMQRHTMINKFLTFLSNWFTDLSLTDVETCYKAINTILLKSIPIRSNDFRFEVEIVFKLAKRRARIFEVPIRYLPRTQEEGKKIKGKDGLLALLAILRFWLVDDLYREDQYGSHILVELERARRFNLWLGEKLRPYLGDRVLEIGAGIGNLTNQFIPRDLYVASDINPHYLQYLRSYSFGKPYLRVLKIDAGNADDFRGLEGQFDTALMINVLEHVPDEREALLNLRSALEPGGRAVVLVPQHPWLYGMLDKALEHRERYTAAGLVRALEGTGFRVEKVFDFNRFSVPGWWLNGRVLGRKRFSRIQLKILDTLMPALKHIDRVIPWKGLSVIAIGVKE